MPHIDDGILHAYLDGALDALSDAGELPDGMSGADVLDHMRTCADCAARLEAERAVREHAGIIVGHAVPATIEPPGLPAAPPRRRRTWVPLSWAASLLLAAGAGWWSSEILRSPEYAGMSESRDQPGSSMEAVESEFASTPTSSIDGGAAGNANEPTTDGAASASVSDAAASRTRTGAASESRQDGRAAPLGDPPIAAAPPPPPPSAAASSAVAQRREAEPQRTPSVDALTVRSLMPTDTSARARAANAALSLDQIVVTGGAGAAALDSALAGEGAGTLVFRDVALQDAARSDAALQDVARAGRSAAVGAIWIVGDATITGVAVADTDEGRLVRVRQRLDTGVPIDVLTWLPRASDVGGLEMSKAADRSAAQAPEVAPASVARTRTFMAAEDSPRLLVDGRRELRLRVVDGPTWVVIRGDLGSASLSALVARLARP